MRLLSVLRGAAAATLILLGALPGAAQGPPRSAPVPAMTKSYTVELDAEKDYFAADTVRIFAVSRAGETEVGDLDVTIRRRKTIAVPANATDLSFRTGKNITAKLKLSSGKGKIVVRPLSNAGSASGIAWMLGRRGGITLERLVVEWAAE